MWELLNAENTMPNSLQISKEFKNSDLHLQLFYNAKIYFFGGGGGWGRGSGAIMFGLDFHHYLGSALGVGREGGTMYIIDFKL